MAFVVKKQKCSEDTSRSHISSSPKDFTVSESELTRIRIQAKPATSNSSFRQEELETLKKMLRHSNATAGECKAVE